MGQIGDLPYGSIELSFPALCCIYKQKNRVGMSKPKRFIFILFPL
jgi:hypothetical protein